SPGISSCQRLSSRACLRCRIRLLPVSGGAIRPRRASPIQDWAEGLARNRMTSGGPNSCTRQAIIDHTRPGADKRIRIVSVTNKGRKLVDDAEYPPGAEDAPRERPDDGAHGGVNDWR